MFTIIQQLCSMKQKHTKYTQINTNKSTHSEMGPVWQNPIQKTVRTAHPSVHNDCAQLQYTTIQHRTVLIIFPLTSSNQAEHSETSLWSLNWKKFTGCLLGYPTLGCRNGFKNLGFWVFFTTKPKKPQKSTFWIFSFLRKKTIQILD